MEEGPPEQSPCSPWAPAPRRPRDSPLVAPAGREAHAWRSAGLPGPSSRVGARLSLLGRTLPRGLRGTNEAAAAPQPLLSIHVCRVCAVLTVHVSLRPSGRTRDSCHHDPGHLRPAASGVEPASGGHLTARVAQPVPCGKSPEEAARSVLTLDCRRGRLCLSWGHRDHRRPPASTRVPCLSPSGVPGAGG